MAVNMGNEDEIDWGGVTTTWTSTNTWATEDAGRTVLNNALNV